MKHSRIWRNFATIFVVVQIAVWQKTELENNRKIKQTKQNKNKENTRDIWKVVDRKRKREKEKRQNKQVSRCESVELLEFIVTGFSLFQTIFHWSHSIEHQSVSTFSFFVFLFFDFPPFLYFDFFSCWVYSLRIINLIFERESFTKFTIEFSMPAKSHRKFNQIQMTLQLKNGLDPEWRSIRVIALVMALTTTATTVAAVAKGGWIHPHFSSKLSFIIPSDNILLHNEHCSMLSHCRQMGKRQKWWESTAKNENVFFFHSSLRLLIRVLSSRKNI